MKQIYCNNLTNLSHLLKVAYKNKYAIGHFNINNLIWAKALLTIAEETRTPIILGVSEGAVRYLGGYNVICDMISALLHDLKITVPVALHLDHGQTYDSISKAIHSGFSSVMFDGSHLSFNENYEITSKVVNLAKKHNVTVEAEIGTIGGQEDQVISDGELANPKHAHKIAKLDITTLAAGFGNIHGVYPKDWKGLSFSVLEEISKESKLPLVLHGGSGIPFDQIKKAISLGVSKVNVNTTCQIAFSKATKEYFLANKDEAEKGFDPRRIFQPGFLAIQKVFIELTQLFGCYGKMDDFLSYSF